ncbi:MAG: hypothetical protein K2G45_05995 [Lachnospiraceae bacterium]|nr:hypothetical protein [Lachnospiraceae bacterium]
MKIRKIAVCICAFTLVASLVIVDALPALAAAKPEISSVAATKETEEMESGGSENNDVRIYVDDVLYNGYYMDNANILYIVSHGVAEPKTGTLKAGATYYSCNAGKMLALAKQTLYVNGKAYTGYYLDSQNKMYSVKNGIRINEDGTRTLKTGTLKAGTKYYSCNAGKMLTLAKQTLYVNGKVYTGYYLDSQNKMYRVKNGIRISENGTRTLKTGTLKAGTKYYSCSKKNTEKLSKNTVYVNGNIYTGYYLDSQNKMYSVKKGTSTRLNIGLKSGVKYYSYNAGKTKKLSKKTVYINGKAVKGMSAKSLTTLQRAQKIVNRITDDSMTKEEKLKVCFEYVQNYEESRPRTPHYTGMDWPVLYANDMFLNGKGNCFSYAAAFAYMAKAIGYTEVYCCNSGNHGWTEINGLVYDPQWSREHHVYNYYGLSYDTKVDVQYKWAIREGLPWMHIKM